MIAVAHILKIRYVFLVATIASFISSLFFIGVGVADTVRAYSLAFRYLGGGEWSNPGVILFEALDRFLIAVLFYIFGVGMIKLFMPERFDEADLPRWLNITGIKELKILLWETVLVTLMVLTVTSVVARPATLTWDALILPAVIAILSVSLFFMRSKVETGGADRLR